MKIQPDKLNMFEKQRNTAEHAKARPYFSIMYYKNHIMLTGENKTQTSKKQESKRKLGRENKQTNQNVIKPNFCHVDSSLRIHIQRVLYFL